MPEMKPTLKIIKVQIEHGHTGMCVVTSEHLPGFFLSTIDDDDVAARIESAIEHYMFAQRGQKVRAEAAEDFDDDLDFKTTRNAMFAARELEKVAA